MIHDTRPPAMIANGAASAEPELTSSEPQLDDRVVFVLGNSRSGTTMTARILGGSPAVFTFRELHFFEQLWSPADRRPSLSPAEAERLAARLLCIQRDGYLTQGDPRKHLAEARALLLPLGGEALSSPRIFEAFLRYEAVKHGKLVPCDQTPRNVFYINEILRFYRGARIINLIRDPRDVLLSQKNKWKRRFLGGRHIPLRHASRFFINYHPITISQLWNASVSAADRFAGHPLVYSVRFEDLVANPGLMIRKICEFVGVPFEESMLDIPQIGSSNVADRTEKKGIDAGRAGSWRRGGANATEIYLCQKITGPSMRRHGYELAPCRPNPLGLIGYALFLPAQSALALLANRRRVRSVREALRRRFGKRLGQPAPPQDPA